MPEKNILHILQQNLQNDVKIHVVNQRFEMAEALVKAAESVERTF